MLKKSKWKSKYFLYEEASHFHKKIRDILLNGKFKGISAYQEVPLEDLIDEPTKLKVDWFLDSLNICIELHGKQHYEQVNFGYKEAIKSELDFIASKNRDSYKRSKLEEHGYMFLEISFDCINKLNEDYFYNLIKETISFYEEADDRKSK